MELNFEFHIKNPLQLVSAVEQQVAKTVLTLNRPQAVEPMLDLVE